MKQSDIIALIVTFLGVAAFAAVFTILYAKYIKSSVREIESGGRDVELIDRSITETDAKVRKRKKIASIVGNVAFYSLLALVVPVLIFAGVSKAQGNVMPFGDTALMVVASGSMSSKNKNNQYLVTNGLDNQFAKFDIIVLEKVPNFESVQLYDVIAFDNPDAQEVYIHRVISIDTQKRTFETRGDANGESDGHRVKFEEVKGRYTNKKAGGIGMIVLFAQSSSGIITVVSVIYVLWMISFFTRKVEKAENARIDKLSAIIADAHGPESRELEASYHETIYYQGFAYRFDENGFIGKETHEGGSDDHTLVRVTSSEKGESRQVIAVDKPPTGEFEGDLTEDLLQSNEDLTEEELLDGPSSDPPPKDNDEDLYDLYDNE